MTRAGRKLETRLLGKPVRGCSEIILLELSSRSVIVTYLLVTRYASELVCWGFASLSISLTHPLFPILYQHVNKKGICLVRFVELAVS